MDELKEIARNNADFLFSFCKQKNEKASDELKRQFRNFIIYFENYDELEENLEDLVQLTN